MKPCALFRSKIKLMTAFSQGRAKTGGRKSGSRNKRTIAAAARPDALLHLEKVMTSTDGTITPDLKLRAAIALATVSAFEARSPLETR